MNQSTDQKAREKFFLERAKSIYPDFPVGELLPSESPDFLVKAGWGTLGIEIIDFVRGQNAGGSKLREGEKTCDRIVNRAKMKFEEQKYIPLQVRFNWTTPPLPNRKLESKLIAEIVNVVNTFAPQEIYQPAVLMEELDKFYIGNFINRISILRKKPGLKSMWANTEAGIIGVSIDELQDIISGKESKLDTYLQKCSSMWLLIVADGEHISSSSDLGEEVQSHVFRGKFNKVLFYDSFRNSITELSIEASGP
ncbi:MAG: hypothetical protein AB7P14_25235 [Blastocatellales bacterium]